MEGMISHWIDSGWSDEGATFTHEVNFEPSFAVAQAYIRYFTGGGLHGTGIVGFRHRPTPGGAEESVNFGGWPWEPFVYVDRCTSVTFGTVVGGNRQHCLVFSNIFFW